MEYQEIGTLISMTGPDDDNPEFKIAADFVNHTNRSIFLTGKAGSGKTTFLKHIVHSTHKNCVVVAPTGVAAINAGGVTMHSFFQLPMGPFVPGTQKKFNGVEVSDSGRLFRDIRMSGEKRNLINELELLIIDEVSMVRCDMLDAMDTILRHFRKRPSRPFGGVQVLFIGDLFQLPPVVRNEEWEILKDYYESPFFFHSKVISAAQPLYIELKKLYRQTDPAFIGLLNKIRRSLLQPDDLELLHRQFKPGFSTSSGDHYVTLCTHNYKADAVNAAELKKLPGPVHRFRGSVEGDFSDKALPTEMELLLKEGSQVIFIKNDSDPHRRYYNGKIAVVKSIEEEQITVEFPENQQTITLDREVWRNIRYAYNRETEIIEEEEIGTFKQFPVRLAWAITIHKSQGLTFQKAIIDAGDSFAPGQVYVALSRCTSLEGMVLRSRIQAASISTDERVIAFAEKEQASEELQQLLEEERQRFQAAQLSETFDFSRLIDVFEKFIEEVPGKKLPDPAQALALGNDLMTKAKDLRDLGNKFRSELNIRLDKVQTEGPAQLEERVRKAISYFKESLESGMLEPLVQHETVVRKAKRVKKYSRLLSDLKFELARQLERLDSARYGDLVFSSGNKDEHDRVNLMKKKAVQSKARAEKGSSLKETLELYKSGKGLEQIAGIRGLAVTTVEGHLAQLVKTGDLAIRELMSEERLEVILHTIEKTGGTSIIPVKQKLGEGYSFGEIRAVWNHLEKMKEKKA